MTDDSTQPNLAAIGGGVGCGCLTLLLTSGLIGFLLTMASWSAYEAGYSEITGETAVPLSGGSGICCGLFTAIVVGSGVYTLIAKRT